MPIVPWFKCWGILLRKVLSLLSIPSIYLIWYKGRLFGVIIESNTAIEQINIVILESNTVSKVVSRVI